MFYVIWYTDLCKFSGNDWKFWNSLGRKQQALWSLWWSLCGFGNFREKLKFLFFFGNVDDFENLEILENYNFQRRRPIMTLGGVYWWKLQCIPFQGVVVFEENAMHFWSKLLCIVGKISCANCNAPLARQRWFWAVFCIRAPQPAPAIAALTFSNISIDFQTQHLLIWSNPWFP